MRFEGKVALVTGGAVGNRRGDGVAARGRGRARRGRRPRRGGARATLAAELGGVALELDVARPDSIAAAVAAAEQQLGPIDVLVNNAGVDRRAFFVRHRPRSGTTCSPSTCAACSP